MLRLSLNVPLVAVRQCCRWADENRVGRWNQGCFVGRYVESGNPAGAFTHRSVSIKRTCQSLRLCLFRLLFSGSKSWGCVVSVRFGQRQQKRLLASWERDQDLSETQKHLPLEFEDFCISSDAGSVSRYVIRTDHRVGESACVSQGH